jgi:protein-tyrosine phosphatase
MNFEIIPRLYLGSIDQAYQFDFIKKYNIHVIFNCAYSIQNKFDYNLLSILDSKSDFYQWLNNNKITYYNIPLQIYNNDPEINDNNILYFYNGLPKYVNNIKEEYESGKNILIHSLSGTQRSYSILVAFLMFYYKWNLSNTIQFINYKKNIKSLDMTHLFYYKALVKYEKDLNL